MAVKERKEIKYIVLDKKKIEFNPFPPVDPPRSGSFNVTTLKAYRSRTR